MTATANAQELRVATRIIRSPFEVPEHHFPGLSFEEIFKQQKKAACACHARDVREFLSWLDEPLLGSISGYEETDDDSYRGIETRVRYGEWWTVVVYSVTASE